MKKSENGNPLSMRDKELLFLKRLLRNETDDAQFIDDLNKAIEAYKTYNVSGKENSLDEKDKVLSEKKSGIALDIGLLEFVNLDGGKKIFYNTIIGLYINHLVGNYGETQNYPYFASLVLVIEALSGNTVNDDEFAKLFGESPLKKAADTYVGLSEQDKTNHKIHFNFFSKNRIINYIANFSEENRDTYLLTTALITRLSILPDLLKPATDVKGDDKKSMAIENVISEYYKSIQPLFRAVYNPATIELIERVISSTFQYIPKLKERDHKNLVVLFTQMISDALIAERTANEINLNVDNDGLNELANSLLIKSTSDMSHNRNTQVTKHNKPINEAISKIDINEKRNGLRQILEKNIQEQLHLLKTKLLKGVERMRTEDTSAKDSKISKFKDLLEGALNQFVVDEQSIAPSPIPDSSSSTKKPSFFSRKKSTTPSLSLSSPTRSSPSQEESFIRSVHESRGSRKSSKKSSSTTLPSDTSTKSKTALSRQNPLARIREKTTPIKYLIGRLNLPQGQSISSFAELGRQMNSNQDLIEQVRSALTFETIHHIANLIPDDLIVDFTAFLSSMITQHNLQVDLLVPAEGSTTLIDKLNAKGSEDTVSAIGDLAITIIQRDKKHPRVVKDQEGTLENDETPTTMDQEETNDAMLAAGLAASIASSDEFNTEKGDIQQAIKESLQPQDSQDSMPHAKRRLAIGRRETDTIFFPSSSSSSSQSASQSPNITATASSSGGEATEPSAPISKWSQVYESQPDNAAPLVAIAENVPTKGSENEDSERRPSTSVSKTDAKSLGGKDKDGNSKGGDEGAR